MMESAVFRNGTVAVVLGDITGLDCDVIVNAANAALSGGGGVDGAIHRAAGPRLLEACRALGSARPGDAVITDGFELGARHVVHAVGPVWRGGDSDEVRLLARAYRESMQRAAEVGAKTIAFPCISTGAYRFPFDRAVAIAIDTVVKNLDEAGLERATFCCFSESDHTRYLRALRDRFGESEPIQTG